MAAGRANFEVQCFENDHWVTQDYRETEALARTLAQKFLKNATIKGVRIIKEWTRADGASTETTIFEEMRTEQAGPVTIVPIDSAPICRKSKDYYQFNSRLTMGRLLRKYLEKVFLTPTELLHNYRALARVQEVDTLFPSAVDKVATLQAKEVGEDSRKRRDDLYQAVAQMSRRARRAEEQGLPKLSKDFDKVVGTLEKTAPPDEIDFLALVVLSRDLLDRRSWLGKLERLVELMNPSMRPESFGLLDGVVADLLGVPAALQDILGYQKNLGAAICAMIDLSEGHAAALAGEGGQSVAALNDFFAKGSLSQSRSALFERILHQLKSGAPLSRNDPTRESDEFKAMCRRLITLNGVWGGSEMTEALVLRQTRMVEQGGATGKKVALTATVTSQADPSLRIVLLTSLLSSELGREMSADILQHLRSIVGVGDFAQLIPPGKSPRERMVIATRLFELLSTAELPEGEGAKLAARVDELLAGYLIKEGIIEKLDRADASLRERSVLLVQFCADMVLPPGGKAIKLARDRVITHLRQPRFDELFLAGITSPEAQEKALRQFHELLGRAGFR